MPFSEYLQRKEGDSNPRYGIPYDSLANCWFQPLTHPSFFALTLCVVACFKKTGAKIDPFPNRANLHFRPISSNIRAYFSAFFSTESG